MKKVGFKHYLQILTFILRDKKETEERSGVGQLEASLPTRTVSTHCQFDFPNCIPLGMLERDLVRGCHRMHCLLWGTHLDFQLADKEVLVDGCKICPSKKELI